MDNKPIYECNGCKTTGGKLSCYKHGQTKFTFGGISKKEDWGHAICPKHKQQFTCPDCDREFEIEVSKVLYNSLGVL